jgi:hypothetical protein
MTKQQKNCVEEDAVRMKREKLKDNTNVEMIARALQFHPRDDFDYDSDSSYE